MPRDRTAMTEPLTTGQQIVAKWEGPPSGWSEPADLAEAIDDAIARRSMDVCMMRDALQRENEKLRGKVKTLFDAICSADAVLDYQKAELARDILVRAKLAANC